MAIASVSTAAYPEMTPFNPAQEYPELPYVTKLDGQNKVYAAVRESLHLLGLDEGRFGTPRWNPLGAVIRPGDRVLVKPNFVLHFNAGGGPLEAVVTHPSIIRPVVDYALIALEGHGRIVIGDSPQMNCDWEGLASELGMESLANYLKCRGNELGIPIDFYDLRQQKTRYRYGVVWERRPVDGVRASQSVFLGSESYMDAIESRLLYGADYARHITVAAHRRGHHEYVVSQDLLESDVVVSIPKLKVHSKVGTTLNLKNMVGINSDKNHLAHYRVGPPERGGDEVSGAPLTERIDRWLSDALLGRAWKPGRYPFVAWRFCLHGGKALARRLGLVDDRCEPYRYGNWSKNDTAWRMALDLNRVVLCSDDRGVVQKVPVRRYFSVIDGVVGGDGDGPLHPEAYRAGAVLAGFNPVVVDFAASLAMGFDPMAIPLYRNGIDQIREWWPECSVESLDIVSDVEEWAKSIRNGLPIWRFRPAGGWAGSIEHPSWADREERDTEACDELTIRDSIGQ